MRYDCKRDYDFDLAVEELERKAEKENDLRAELTNLENRLFLVNMVDRWTDADREMYRKTKIRITEIKLALK